MLNDPTIALQTIHGDPFPQTTSWCPLFTSDRSSRFFVSTALLKRSKHSYKNVTFIWTLTAKIYLQKKEWNIDYFLKLCIQWHKGVSTSTMLIPNRLYTSSDSMLGDVVAADVGDINWFHPNLLKSTSMHKDIHEYKNMNMKQSISGNKWIRCITFSLSRSLAQSGLPVRWSGTLTPYLSVTSSFKHQSCKRQKNCHIRLECVVFSNNLCHIAI